MMMKCCLMSSDVSWHIRDKLWPVPKHGSIILYVHGNQKARYDGQPRMSISTLTHLLNYEHVVFVLFCFYTCVLLFFLRVWTEVYELYVSWAVSWHRLPLVLLPRARALSWNMWPVCVMVFLSLCVWAVSWKIRPVCMMVFSLCVLAVSWNMRPVCVMVFSLCVCSEQSAGTCDLYAWCAVSWNMRPACVMCS